MDLHADQIQGFFDIPVDNIYASPVLLGDLRQKNYDDLIVISPRWRRGARALAKQLNCDLAIIGERRPKANVGEVMHRHRRDRWSQLRDHGRHDRHRRYAGEGGRARSRSAAPRQVYAYCTHPIFSGPAIERINVGSALDEVVVTNTIPLSLLPPPAARFANLPWPR